MYEQNHGREGNTQNLGDVLVIKHTVLEFSIVVKNTHSESRWPDIQYWLYYLLSV